MIHAIENIAENISLIGAKQETPGIQAPESAKNDLDPKSQDFIKSSTALRDNEIDLDRATEIANYSNENYIDAFANGAQPTESANAKNKLHEAMNGSRARRIGARLGYAAGAVGRGFGKVGRGIGRGFNNLVASLNNDADAVAMAASPMAGNDLSSYAYGTPFARRGLASVSAGELILPAPYYGNYASGGVANGFLPMLSLMYRLGMRGLNLGGKAIKGGISLGKTVSEFYRNKKAASGGLNDDEFIGMDGKPAKVSSTDDDADKAFVSHVDFLGGVHQYQRNAQGELEEQKNDRETDAARDKMDNLYAAITGSAKLSAAQLALMGLGAGVDPNKLGALALGSDGETKNTGLFQNLSSIYNTITGGGLLLGATKLAKNGIRNLLSKKFLGVSGKAASQMSLAEKWAAYKSNKAAKAANVADKIDDIGDTARAIDKATDTARAGSKIDDVIRYADDMDALVDLDRYSDVITDSVKAANNLDNVSDTIRAVDKIDDVNDTLKVADKVTDVASGAAKVVKGSNKVVSAARSVGQKLVKFAKGPWLDIAIAVALIAVAIYGVYREQTYYYTEEKTKKLFLKELNATAEMGYCNEFASVKDFQDYVESNAEIADYFAAHPIGAVICIKGNSDDITTGKASVVYPLQIYAPATNTANTKTKYDKARLSVAHDKLYYDGIKYQASKESVSRNILLDTRVLQSYSLMMVRNFDYYRVYTTTSDTKSFKALRNTWMAKYCEAALNTIADVVADILSLGLYSVGDETSKKYSYINFEYKNNKYEEKDGDGVLDFNDAFFSPLLLEKPNINTYANSGLDWLIKGYKGSNTVNSTESSYISANTDVDKTSSSYWNSKNDALAAHYSNGTTSGRGSGLRRGRRFVGGSGAFVSQLGKYKNIRYGNSTIGDIGCAPAAATNLVSALGGNLSMTKAISAGRKYTNANGTDINYFNDVLGQAGYKSESLGSVTDVAAALSNNKPVVLLGKDSNNTSKDVSSFGPRAHYVVATKGNPQTGTLNIWDSENSAPREYNAANILNGTMAALTAGLSGSGTKPQILAGLIGNSTANDVVNPDRQLNGTTSTGETTASESTGPQYSGISGVLSAIGDAIGRAFGNNTSSDATYNAFTNTTTYNGTPTSYNATTTYNRYNQDAGLKSKIDAMIQRAKAMVGTEAYSQPNRDVPGFSDCSKWASTMYKNYLGVNIGGDTYTEMSNLNNKKVPGFNFVDYTTGFRDIGKTEEVLSKLQPGDLLFFRNKGFRTQEANAGKSRNGDVSHVEMYLGDGKIIGQNSSGPTKIINGKEYGTGPTIKDLRGSTMYSTSLFGDNHSKTGTTNKYDRYLAAARYVTPSGGGSALRSFKRKLNNYGITYKPRYRRSSGMYGGASGVLDEDYMIKDTTKMLNNLQSTIVARGKAGEMSDDTVTQLLMVIVEVLRLIATNTTPVNQIYSKLGELGSMVTSKSSSTSTTNTAKKGRYIPSSGFTPNSALQSLVNGLASFAKG